MWTCYKCGRIFKKANQPHSCRKIPLEKHFVGKEKARELFNYLVKQINDHTLNRKINSPRLKICVPMSKKVFKNCFDIRKKEELDGEFIGWLKQSYNLKT